MPNLQITAHQRYVSTGKKSQCVWKAQYYPCFLGIYRISWNVSPVNKGWRLLNQVLTRMWSNWNFYALLVEWQIGTVTPGTCLAASSLNISTITNPKILHQGIRISTEMWTDGRQKMYWISYCSTIFNSKNLQAS